MTASTPPPTGANEGAELGYLLRRWRKRAGLSQSALAERASLSTAAIAALEQGQRRQPHPNTLRQLASALGLDADEEAALAQRSSPTRTSAPRSSWSSSDRQRESMSGGVSSTWTASASPTTPLIGRDNALCALADLLLGNPPARLVTLTGPGGVGKTQLALALAGMMQPRFGDGALLLELASLHDWRLLEPTIIRALGVREMGATTPRFELVEVLRRKHILLILDNFEHLTGAATLLAALVDACPRVSLLVTSRTALRVRAERRFALEPLGLPAATETSISTIANSPAVQLFADRARATSPAFEVTPDNAATVAAICRRLDGLPLAIELATARILELPPRALLSRLGRRLALLVDGSTDLPERQRTLRATLDWSYTLLAPAEQSLFRQLAIFAGGWTLPAAEAVCAIDGDALLRLQASLVDRSLVRPAGQTGDEVRFDMLEILREYGMEKLAASGEEDALRRRAAAYYQSLAETAERGLQNEQQSHWLSVLASEQDNVRSVLRWALEAGEIDLGLSIASAIWQFWWVAGQMREGRQWLDDLLAEQRETTSSTKIRSKALNAAAGLAMGMGDYALARERYEQAVAAARAAGDRERLAVALHNLGYLAAEQGDTATVITCVEASLTHARAVGDLGLVAADLCTLGEGRRQQRDLARASALLEQSLALLRRIGDQLWEASALRHLAEVARDRQDWLTAEARYKDALRISQALGAGYSLGIVRNFEGLAEIALEAHQASQAARLLGAAGSLREAIGSPPTPLARVPVERVREAARADLGDAQFDAAFQEGARLDRREAMAFALNSRWTVMEATSELSPGELVRSPSFAPPPVRPNSISRRRLLQRLDAALQHGVTLVAAPAGSGKTTLLADWVASLGSRAVVAWVSLDRSDDDPSRFWRHVFDAMEAQRPHLVDRARQAVRDGIQRPDALVDQLLADLAELDMDLVLVLDDYHIILSPQIHSGLSTLLRQAPPAFHLLISSRQDPPLPLARRRAAADLVELRTADLRFSEAEAAGLLGAVVGRELAPAQVQTVMARTEGWAAGLQLAALTLRDAPAVDDSIARFRGSDQFVIDYFVEEVLSQLSDQERRFLIGTSVLSRLCAPLCDAVLMTTGSAAILQELDARSLFIAPIDADRQWFRYHALFAEVLQHALRREATDLEVELRSRAVEWYVANGFVEDAIEQALAARNWERAAELLMGQAPSLIERGEEATVNRWLTPLPQNFVLRHPWLSPMRAAALLQLGDVDSTLAFLAAAEGVAAELHQTGTLGALFSLHAAAADAREDSIARDYAQRAMSLLGPADPPVFRLLALNAIARSDMRAGAPQTANEALDEAVMLMNRVVVPMAGLQTHHHLGHLRLMEGRLRAAGAQFESLLTLTGDRPLFSRHQALISLAALAYERNLLTDARELLGRAAEARREAGRWVDLPFPWLLAARLARATGDLSTAREALERCVTAAQRFGQVRLQRHARAERARLDLDVHDLDAASRWAVDLDSTADDLDTYAREPELLMRTRVWLATGRPREAIPALMSALARAERARRGASIVAILTVLALAHAHLGQNAEAVHQLEHALRLAEPEGYVRVFVDEGDALGPLLRVISRHEGVAGYAARLLAALSASNPIDGPQSPDRTATGLLTRREQAVLELLAEGLSNRAIAAQLVTSEGTIKSHVHHLIGKFGVTTRAQVLVRARQEGLLEVRQSQSAELRLTDGAQERGK